MKLARDTWLTSQYEAGQLIGNPVNRHPVTIAIQAAAAAPRSATNPAERWSRI
jgi:hypothetical protein